MPAKGRKISGIVARTTQKPANRKRAGRQMPLQARVRNWQNWRAYVPAMMVTALCLTIAIVLAILYYAATSSSFFQLRDITVSGNTRITTEEIRAVVQRQASATGVWHVNLDNLSAEINRLPWVQQAIVSRILPDGLRVQIKERNKSAVILAGNNKLMWVDDEGVRLGPYTAADKVPNLLVLKGWNEAPTEAAQNENARRMKIYQDVRASWELLGLTKYVSEMDLSTMQDVRAFLHSRPEVPIMLGDRNWGPRLKDAMQTLARERANEIEALDAKLDNGDVIVATRQTRTTPTPGAAPVTTGDRTRPVAPKPR